MKMAERKITEQRMFYNPVLKVIARRLQDFGKEQDQLVRDANGAFSSEGISPEGYSKISKILYDSVCTGMSCTPLQAHLLEFNCGYKRV